MIKIRSSFKNATILISTKLSNKIAMLVPRKSLVKSNENDLFLPKVNL